MSNKSLILSGFNNHFSEFLDDVLRIFPNNKDILTAKKVLTTIRSMNPKLIITFWKNYIVSKYGDQIESGDCDYFLNKDYTADITDTQGSPELADAIERLRGPLSELNNENLAKCVQYLQNLSKLSMLYE
jgi:hypothetical protein